MTCLVIFDDGSTGDAKLAPLCDLRASFELRTGAVTTAERLARQIGQPIDAMVVPHGLDVVVSTRTDVPINALPEGDGPCLFVNGRLTSFDIRPPHEVNTAHVDEHGAVIAALLDRKNAQAFLDVYAAELSDDVDVEPVDDVGMLRRPWQVIQAAARNISDDVSAMKGYATLDPAAHPMTAVVGEHPVRIGEDVTVHPMTVFNAIGGPILIDHDVRINAHCVIYGPCYIGPGTSLHHRTDVGRSAVGPGCKLGGEVNNAVIQGNTNKGHDGYLGDSYLGEWVNLGAGTTTSNLKNTYGEVAMRIAADADPEPTGMGKLGAVIGDHVKTAIGTRLLTGTCVGTGAMVALSKFCPKYVDPFSFLTDDREASYVLERFALVADRAMQRRGMRVTAELTQRFAQLLAGR